MKRKCCGQKPAQDTCAGFLIKSKQEGKCRKTVHPLLLVKQKGRTVFYGIFLWQKNTIKMVQIDIKIS